VIQEGFFAVTLSAEQLQPQRSAPCETIERRAGLTRDEFRRSYLHARKPVILTDASKDWPALSRWTPDYFVASYGARNVQVTTSGRSLDINFAHFVAYLKLREQAATEGELLYLRNLHVCEEFPELLRDFTIAAYFRPNWLGGWPLKKFAPAAWHDWAELFIGPPGARFPFVHFDTAMTHAWVSQVYGRKQFWMVSPGESALMYPDEKKINYSPINDLEHPDLNKFPLFAKAHVLTCILGPGDTLFVPAGWWHTAECKTVSITVAGNFVNDSNYADFRRAMVLPMFRGKPRIKRLLNAALLRFHGFVRSLAARKV
jgi:cupin-like protein